MLDFVRGGNQLVRRLLGRLCTRTRVHASGRVGDLSTKIGPGLNLKNVGLESRVDVCRRCKDERLGRSPLSGVPWTAVPVPVNGTTAARRSGGSSPIPSPRDPRGPLSAAANVQCTSHRSRSPPTQSPSPLPRQVIDSTEYGHGASHPFTTLDELLFVFYINKTTHNVGLSSFLAPAVGHTVVPHRQPHSLCRSRPCSFLQTPCLALVSSFSYSV